MPAETCVSVFTENDLTNIGDDYFEINLMARLLNQIYVVPTTLPRYDIFDEQIEGAMEGAIASTSTGASPMASCLLLSWANRMFYFSILYYSFSGHLCR